MAVSPFTIEQIVAAWNAFFHAPTSPDTLALFRISFGMLLMADALFLAPSLNFLFGTRGVLDRGIYLRDFSSRFFSIYNWAADGPAMLSLMFAAHVAAIICLALGFFSNIAALVVFIGLVSYHDRNPFMVNSGDVAMRLMAFLLIFAPSDAAWSMMIALGLKPAQAAIDPWAYRLLQILVSVIYFKSMYWKLHGQWWMSGKAVYYVLNIRRYIRFPLPAFLKLKFVYQAFNYGTLVVWGALAICVWIDELRYPALILGVLYHLGMDFCLRIRLFQWVMMTGLVLFVSPGDAHAILGFVFAQ